MHHPGHGRRKVRTTDRCGRTGRAISCMRLVETLDRSEREVWRVVKRCVRHQGRNFDLMLPKMGGRSFQVGGFDAHRTAVRRCFSGRAAAGPSRVGQCFAVAPQRTRLRYLNGLHRRRTWLCRKRLFRRDHVIWLREGCISMGLSKGR